MITVAILYEEDFDHVPEHLDKDNVNDIISNLGQEGRMAVLITQVSVFYKDEKYILIRRGRISNNAFTHIKKTFKL